MLNLNSINLKRILCSHILWLFLAILLVFNSCSGHRDNGDYSPEFKAIFDTVVQYSEIKKEPQKGTRYLDSSFKRLKQPFVNDWFRFYSIHFVYQKKEAHNAPKSLLYADSMLMMAKNSVTKKQYQLNYAEANFASGDAYFDLRQYSSAYKCYYQGYFIGKNLINNEILAEYTYRMGMILFKQGYYNKAASYFKISYRQSMAYKDNFKAFYQRQELLANIGESYKNANMIDSAALYLTKALDYINANSARYSHVPNLLDVARGVVYGDQGEIALISHKYTLAEYLLKKSIAINLRPGNDNRDAQLTEIKLSRLYLLQNKTDQLFDLLKTLRVQLDTLSNEDVEPSWNELMSRYYTQKKDYEKALHYLKTYSSLKDSAVNKVNSLRGTDVNQQQANFDKQTQIDSLTDHNKTQFIYTNLAVVFFIMAVIIIFLVFRNLKRSKKDIIAVKALNDQINDQNNHLEAALSKLKYNSQEKDRILRAVAHDLRNPIGGIASLTSVMVADDDYTPEQKEMLTLIKDTSFNSLELINEILEATNAANATLNKELTEINALLSNSVELLRFKAAEKNQVINLKLLDTQQELLMSREKIWRVISNLISNAIKFSPANANILVKAVNYEREVQVSVKDNGIGIPDKLKGQVFNMFTDAKRPGTGGEKSFGLGLSICKQIMEKHNGRIWFDSDTENGTTFYLSLPK
ncbi:ATP-binding protein [Mucilaginibacter pocheonensis]|uniref:histidine kinase n=1 Tax=Mucilaginibacter pocheonensis TaxID=398050 RepID=A0ABU1TD04_9SPHI|nr:ATP-binding protein [Mucilaginibacter pocheonensis]MDR6943273.1 signal transduction histidine kinase [Mucilaginibacter pocheonensis]